MAEIRGGKRFFRIGRDDPADSYGTGAAGFEDPAVTGAGLDMRFFDVSEGAFSLKATPAVEEQAVLRGLLGVHFREKTGWNVAGDTTTLFQPETAGYFLDAALLRDANGELATHTLQEFYPGVDATEKGESYLGCKSNQLQMSFGQGNNKIQLTTSWIGRRAKKYVATAPTPLANAMATKAGYFFSNSSLVDFHQYSAGTASDYVLPACDYSEVNFTVANNLSPGPACFDPDDAINGTITSLVAGQERLSGGFTAYFKNVALKEHFRNFANVAFRCMFIHPSSNKTLALSNAETAGAAVVLNVSADPTSLVAVGDVIAIQKKGGGSTTTQWITARVTARATGPNTITVENLDLNLDTGDVIWTEAAEIIFKKVNLTDFTVTGGPEDARLTVSGSFEAKSDGSGLSGQISYRVKNANYATGTGHLLPQT